MLQQLRSLDPFASLDLPALRTVAHHATCLDLPAGRRLRQSGGSLRGDYYLLSGRLKAPTSNTIIMPGAQPVMLGESRGDAAAQQVPLVTLTPVRLLHIDIEPIAFLLEEQREHASSEYADEDSWQSRFLRSHMLAPLPFSHWQKILGGLEGRDYRAGEWVFRKGERGEECFIVARGTGNILSGKQQLRRLRPGDFFGEDALFSDVGRNACVQMCSPGRLMVLDAQIFHCWLADLLVGGAGLDELHSNQRLQRLTVDSAEDLRTRLQSLDPCTGYRVQGDSRLRRLAVLLLRQRGIRAELA